MTDSFLVPSLAGSPWESLAGTARPMSAEEMARPRLGLYCRHSDQPAWLLGSFVAEEGGTGARHWAWWKDFRTGDGQLLELERTRKRAAGAVSGAQYLVGNRLVDAEADRRALVAAQRAGDLQRAAEVAGQLVENVTRTRARVPLRCGGCGMSRAFRGERVQSIVQTLWDVGYRDIDLETFARRVDRSA